MFSKTMKAWRLKEDENELQNFMKSSTKYKVKLFSLEKRFKGTKNSNSRR